QQAAKQATAAHSKLVDNAKPGNDVTWDYFQQPARGDAAPNFVRWQFLILDHTIGIRLTRRAPEWTGPNALVAASDCVICIFFSRSCNAEPWQKRRNTWPFPSPSCQKRSPTLSICSVCACSNATVIAPSPRCSAQRYSSAGSLYSTSC